MHTTTSTTSTKNTFFYFSQLSLPYFTLTYSRNHLYNPHQHSLLLYLSSFSPPYFLRATIPTIYTKNIFPTSSIWPIQAAPRDQGARESCEDWHCFNLSLLPQSKDSDNRAHNHWFLIAQAQKSGVLQVVFADQYAFNWNGKPFSPPSLIPSIYNYYFDTLLISSQELTFPWKPVT